ncbi:uridine diphosphate glucose pyrophosphatase NUDT22-like [Glandiceps talaboti]
MDPDINLWFTSNGISKSNVRVVLGDQFNRKVLDTHETNIETIWAKRVEQNPRLFNGSKFRLDSAKYENNGVTLNLGLTCYKDYLGTNWSPEVKSLHKYGVRDFENSQVYLSDPAGVGALVQTVDDYVMFMRRSDKVGEAPGLWDVPGGHPEPEELLALLGKDKKLDIKEFSISEFGPDDVVEEIFNSILREVRDEINIPMKYLSEPVLLGVAGNNTSAGRPSMEFFIRCSLSSTEVNDLYSSGGAEAEESTNLKLVPIQEVFDLHNNSIWKGMAPSAKGCVKLFQASKEQKQQSD